MHTNILENIQNYNFPAVTIILMYKELLISMSGRDSLFMSLKKSNLHLIFCSTDVIVANRAEIFGRCVAAIFSQLL